MQLKGGEGLVQIDRKQKSQTWIRHRLGTIDIFQLLIAPLIISPGFHLKTEQGTWIRVQKQIQVRANVVACINRHRHMHKCVHMEALKIP